GVQTCALPISCRLSTTKQRTRRTRESLNTMNINIEKDMQKAIKAAAKEARRAAKAEARAVKEAKKQERRDRLARHGRFLSPNGRNWAVPDQNGGTIKTPQGRFPVAGAHVIVDHGANIGSRISGTRVAAGAVLLGPVGAILGGMAKKDRSKIYIVATLSDGTVVSSDAPASCETVA